MGTIRIGMVTGIIIGNLYFFIELFWNIISKGFYQNLKSFIIGLLIYNIIYALIGISVTFVTKIFFVKKERPPKSITVQSGWIITIISGCFFGSMFLLQRPLFVYSGLIKATIVLSFCILAVTSCILLYFFTIKFGSHNKEQAVSFHYNVLVLLNIFIILVIKANIAFRTQPWSSYNLMWDFIIFVGLFFIGTLYQLLKYFYQHKTKYFTIKITVVLVCSGILLLLFAAPKINIEDDNNKMGTGYINAQNRVPVILITLDTVRADHLSSYGYSRLTSPNIDEIANEGIRFINAICQVPLTRPSHFSIFTGRYPYSHGLLDNFSVTPKGLPLLSKKLSDEKYHSAAFVSSAILNSSFNTKFGFEKYYDKIVNVTFDGNLLILKNLRYFGLIEIKAENSAAETNQKVFEWLEENTNQPFFIWIHYFDPHTPYSPISEYRKLFSEKNYDLKYLYDYQWEKENYDPKSKTVQVSKEIIKYATAMYDAEIRYLDHNVGLLFKKLKKLNLYDKSLIILTADHGESFEHGYYFDHGDRLYESLVRVPLIIKFPFNKWKGKIVEDQIETVDLAPTILDVLDLKPLAGAEGRSRMDLISGVVPSNWHHKEYSFAQTPFRGGFYFKAKELVCLRTNQWKFLINLRTGKEELYEIGNDSKEERNLIDTHLTVLKKFHSKFSELKENAHINKIDQNKIEIDDATMEKFKSLGYTQ